MSLANAKRWIWRCSVLLIIICGLILQAHAGHNYLETIDFPACEGMESGEWYTQSFLYKNKKDVVTYLFIVEKGFRLEHPDPRLVVCMVQPESKILILQGGKDA